MARQDQSFFVRFYAVQALWKIGRETEGAVDILLEGAALTEELHWPAFLSSQESDLLLEMGRTSRACLESIIRSVKHGDWKYRLTAIEILARIDPPTPEAVRVFRSAIGDESSEVRIAAAEALWDIAREAGPAVRLHIKRLEEGDEEERRQAANALGRYGPEARDAVPALAKAVESDYRDLPECAAAAC
jgi:HEAT repeat protein